MSSLKAMRRYGMSYVHRCNNNKSLWIKSKMNFHLQCRATKRMRLRNKYLISLFGNDRYFFSDRAGSGIHPDFQTSYKTGDIDQVKKQIETDVKENDTFLFMKGTPAMPQCGFSKTMITILNYLEVEYQTRDVLSHPALRQAVKEFR